MLGVLWCCSEFAGIQSNFASRKSSKKFDFLGVYRNLKQKYLQATTKTVSPSSLNCCPTGTSSKHFTRNTGDESQSNIFFWGKRQSSQKSSSVLPHVLQITHSHEGSHGASASKEPSQMVAPAQCLSKIMGVTLSGGSTQTGVKDSVGCISIMTSWLHGPKKMGTCSFSNLCQKTSVTKLGSRGTLECLSKVCKSQNGWHPILAFWCQRRDTKHHSITFRTQTPKSKPPTPTSSQSTFPKSKTQQNTIIHHFSPLPPTGRPPASTFLLLNFQAFLGSHPPNVAVSPTRAHTAPGSRDASAARGDRTASTRQPPRLTEADSTGRRRSTPFSCKDTQPRSGPGEQRESREKKQQLAVFCFCLGWGSLLKKKVYRCVNT